jgi:hypothetical protein
MASTGRQSDHPGYISNIIADLVHGNEVRLVINRPPNGVKDALVNRQSYEKEAVVNERREGHFKTFDSWDVIEVSMRKKDSRDNFSLLTLVPSNENRVVFNTKRGRTNLYTVQEIEVIK